MTHVDGGSADLSPDDVFALLADERRRYALYELRDEEHLGMDELAGRVASREAGSDGDAPDDLRVRVTVDLHHCHVPKLQEAGLVEYDRRHGDVSVFSTFESIEKYLDVAEPDDRR